MLISLQFPFADARPFIPADTHRVPLLPAWNFADVEKNFVRAFGAIRPRRKGGIEDWAGEEHFCRVTGLVKFPLGAPVLASGPRPGARTRCAYRRFLYDGCAAARLELGLATAGRRHRYKLEPAAALRLAAGVLATRVSIRTATGTRSSCALAELAQLVASSYLYATTRSEHGVSAPAEPWWITPGRPVVLFEYLGENMPLLPRGTRPVALPLEHLRLHFSRLATSWTRQPMPVWFLGYEPEADPDLVRRVRIHLLRLHSEREVLRCILKQVSGEQLRVVRGHPASEALQAYLRDAFRLLNRKSRSGIEQSAILAVAQDSDALVAPGERATLLRELASVRRNVLRTVEANTTAPPGSGQTVQILGDDAVVFLAHEQRIGERTMTKFEISFGDHATFMGDFVVAQTIQRSFNRAAESGADPELKTALTSLAEQLATAAAAMPPERAREAAHDLDTLTTEALSPKPRRRWYELSAEGLIDAAKSVGEIATPVIATVTKILGLLSGAAV